MLEKHGYLGLEVRDASALDDPAIWNDFDVVIAGPLPGAAWRREIVQRCVESGCPLLVDGPCPPPLGEALGVTRTIAARPEVVVVATDPALVAAAKAFGSAPGGKMVPPYAKKVDRDSRYDWEALAERPISAGHATRWRAPGWSVEQWALDGTQSVMAEWYRRADGKRYPAIVRKGNVVGLATGLLTYLGQCHTAPPTEGGSWFSSPVTLGLEIMALGLIDLLFATAGVDRARALPWPRGARWVLNVRHDFDRPLGPQSVSEVLRQHDRVGTRATWYWRARHLAPLPGLRARLMRRGSGASQSRDALRLVASHPDHEVALHTEMLWSDGEAERSVVERISGTNIAGTTAHGDPGTFRFQGALNVLWAERAGMAYTEMLQHAHHHPHRFAWLDADGSIAPLSVLCLPHHESFDRSMQSGETYAERITASPGRFAATGGLLQVMNHPDLNQRELFEVLGDMPKDGRLDWTAREAADWWRRSHVRDNLRIETADDGKLHVWSRLGADGLELELRRPDGDRVVRTFDVPAGERRSV